MKLYYAPGACSQASHIALIETGLPFDLERVEFGMPHVTASGEELRNINAKGSVPALRLDDGSLLTENAVILQYVADLAPSSGLAPAAGSMARYRLMEWLNFIAGELHKNFSPLFQPGTPEDYKPIAQGIVEARLDYIENALLDEPYLLGTDFSVADAYLFVVLNWAEIVGMDSARWPKLQAIRGRVAERESVQQALKTEGLLTD